MITGFLINVLFFFLTGILFPISNLPDVTLPASITQNLSSAGSYIAAINQVFPATTLLTIIGLLISIETAIVTYKLIAFVIRKIPTIS
jgi:hypothetical protein